MIGNCVLNGITGTGAPIEDEISIFVVHSDNTKRWHFLLLNSSRADFRFCGKCKMFEIAMVLSITHVLMFHTNLWSFPVLYSMPISEFPIPSSKNRFALTALFSPFLSHLSQTTMWQSWHGLERNFRIKLNPLSEILLIVWNLEHQELK